MLGCWEPKRKFRLMNVFRRLFAERQQETSFRQLLKLAPLGSSLALCGAARPTLFFLSRGVGAHVHAYTLTSHIGMRRKGKLSAAWESKTEIPAYNS